MDTKIERRDPPQWVVDHITMKGGLNPYGEPNFRVIWGGNRTYQVGGRFKDVHYVKDSDGNDRAIILEVVEMRTLLKYHPHRWHLERWRGPEYYGDSQEWYINSWDEDCQMHTMGEYPSRGDYEHVFFLAECPHMLPGDTDWCMNCQVGMGEYIDLEPNVAVLDMQIYALKKSEEVSPPAEMAALFMREHIKRNIRNKIVGERVHNAMRPRLVINPSTLMDDHGRCKVPEPKKFDVEAPSKRLGFSQVKPPEEKKNAPN